jgi:hypothetical protein
MTNIPVTPTVLALSFDLKDVTGKMYCLKVQLDCNITFALQQVTNDATSEATNTNDPAGLVVDQNPQQHETVNLATSESDSTDTSDEDFSGSITEGQPSRSATNPRPSRVRSGNREPVRATNNPPPAVSAPVARATTNKPPAATANLNRRAPATRNRGRPPQRPVVFSDEEEDFDTAPASQELFW